MSNEKCNCFDDLLSRAKVELRKQVNDDVTEFDAKWINYSFFMSGDHCPVNPKIELTYREIKRSGEPKANLTKKQISILCSHCPMCGRKLAGSGGDVAQKDLPNDKTEPS